MHQINLSDELYEEVQRPAASGGFATVDAYVADVLAGEFEVAAENLDHFLTPERLKLIDEAVADVDAGNFYTLDEAKKLLDKARQEWLTKRAGRN